MRGANTSGHCAIIQVDFSKDFSLMHFLYQVYKHCDEILWKEIFIKFQIVSLTHFTEEMRYLSKKDRPTED